MSTESREWIASKFQHRKSGISRGDLPYIVLRKLLRSFKEYISVESFFPNLRNLMLLLYQYAPITWLLVCLSHKKFSLNINDMHYTLNH